MVGTALKIIGAAALAALGALIIVTYPPRPSTTVSGDGSSTVFPISEAVAEEFQVLNRDVAVTVGVSGTGGGFKRFCAGETDFQDASRPVKDEEWAICERNGVEFVELTVAFDGLAVVTNPKNTWVECLAVDELSTIWEPGSRVDRWSQVREGFPDEGITLFGPGTDSGTFDYFTDVINGEEGASRADYTASEDDNTLVTGVAGGRGGELAYFGFAFYEENADRLKLLAVDGGAGCVLPSDETVRNGTYDPLSRPLFIYVNVAAARRPEVRAFVDFYLENVGALVGDVGYTPMDPETLDAQVQRWRRAAEEPA